MNEKKPISNYERLKEIARDTYENVDSSEVALGSKRRFRKAFLQRALNVPSNNDTDRRITKKLSDELLHSFPSYSKYVQPHWNFPRFVVKNRFDDSLKPI